MPTSLHAFQLEQDQAISVTLTFDIEAEGSPDGWRITSAICTELAVWLDDDQAEEAQALCVDKTAWLVKWIAKDAVDARRIEEALTERWEADRADDAEYSGASWLAAEMLV